MVTVESRLAAVPAERRVLRTADEALEHVHAICFKTGPPRTVGVELEWTVHHADDPSRPIDPSILRTALGDYAPHTLDPDSPQRPLPHGGSVTLEPGGQVEISTPPSDSLSRLLATTADDVGHLTDRLASNGLRLGEYAIDPYRPPRRLLRTPRYDAMAASFARHGSAGLTMMCGTAATQVCLDAGEPGQVVARWQALHAIGPVLVALFANSHRHAGVDTGWASARMRAWLAADPARTWPVAGADPATAWAEYALAAPLLCVRRDGRSWEAPAGVTFMDWIGGAVRPRPTVGDLEYHLGTLFPPVRPRGYLEVRFLDSQPPAEWFAPVAVVAALLADPVTTDRVREIAGSYAAGAGGGNGSAAPRAGAGVAGNGRARGDARAGAGQDTGAWTTAARYGLADPRLRTAAEALAELACGAFDHIDLTVATRDAVAAIVSRRLAGGGES